MNTLIKIALGAFLGTLLSGSMYAGASYVKARLEDPTAGQQYMRERIQERTRRDRQVTMELRRMVWRRMLLQAYDRQADYKKWMEKGCNHEGSLYLEACLKAQTGLISENDFIMHLLKASTEMTWDALNNGKE